MKKFIMPAVSLLLLILCLVMFFNVRDLQRRVDALEMQQAQPVQQPAQPQQPVQQPVQPRPQQPMQAPQGQQPAAGFELPAYPAQRPAQPYPQAVERPTYQREHRRYQTPTQE